MKKVKKQWTMILQTRDGFSKFHFVNEPTPVIGINWWLPGLKTLNFKCMTLDQETKTGFYLMDSSL